MPCPRQLIGSISSMPSFLIPCSGQFIRFPALFSTPFSCPGQFSVSLFCLVLLFHAVQHSVFHHWPDPRFTCHVQFSVSLPWTIFSFRGQGSSLFPWPVQLSISAPCSVLCCFLYWPVLQFLALVSSPFPCPVQFSVSTPWSVPCFPDQFSYPFPHPGQLPVSLTSSVLRFRALISSLFT
jgi:hypothetical protein